MWYRSVTITDFHYMIIVDNSNDMTMIALKKKTKKQFPICKYLKYVVKLVSRNVKQVKIQQKTAVTKSGHPKTPLSQGHGDGVNRSAIERKQG